MYEWRRQIQIIVDEIDRCIRNHDDEALTLRALSRKLGYSEFHTTRKFREISGMPFRDYLRRRPDDYDLDIDILFISHFDDDHVNGLAELSKKHRIKRIVIPQIQGYEWFYVLEDSIKRGTYQPRGNLINSFLNSIRNETSQNEIQIIEIAPIDSEERPGRNNYDAQSINAFNYQKFWPSGLGFYPFEKEIGWLYIPVNTDYFGEDHPGISTITTHLS